MRLVKTDFADILTLQSWFPDEDASYAWGGPGFRFPFSQQSFLEDICWGKMPAYSQRDEQGKLIAFGQYYEKSGRCHLARLVVSPQQRSAGIGRMFISQLMNIGMAELNTSECSLFVIRHNEKALKCYQALGFKQQEYPENHQCFEDIDFMVYAVEKR